MNTLLALTPIPAEINADQMINLVIQLVVVGAIVCLLLWAVSYIGIPQPFAKIIQVVVVLFSVVYLARLLLSLT